MITSVNNAVLVGGVIEPSKWGRNARIVDNYMEGNPDMPFITQWAPVGFDGAIGTGNTLVNGSFYSDTFPYLNTVASNNTVRNGGFMSQSISENLSVINNTFSPGKNGIGIQLSAPARNTLIAGNRIIKGPATYGIVINNLNEVRTIDGTRIVGNAVDGGMINGTIFDHPGTNTICIGNRTPAGAVVTGLEDTAVIGDVSGSVTPTPKPEGENAR
ncbi:MAG TPA: hypothetical protein VK474_04175 [Chthoniobacterales bacterium]|nr:hypothetical protein [Chthoniobacterales bacterium]